MGSFTISYGDKRERCFGYTVREAVRNFREEHGLKYKRLGGELVVYTGDTWQTLKVIHCE